MNALSFAPLRRARSVPPPVPADFASLLLLAPVEAGAGKSAELDRVLFRCCAEAAEADRAAARIMDGIDTIPDDCPALWDALDLAMPLLDTYEAAVARAVQTPARTPEGLRAKAQLLLLHLAAEQDIDALAGSLARDVAGRV